MQKSLARVALLIAILMMMLPAAPAAAQPIPQDVITVGTSTGAANTVVNVPVYIRDTSGTPLGIDQPPGSRIQSYSIKVNYNNASMVSSVTFTRGGITQSLTPTFESSPSGPGTITLLDTFAENTNLIPFTSNAALPGNQVATLHFTLNGTATPGSVITLTLDPTLTQLTDQMGSPATRETTTAGNLLLVAGAINVVSAHGPTLSMWGLIALALALGFVAIRMRL
jgi:hypothetical protein